MQKLKTFSIKIDLPEFRDLLDDIFRKELCMRHVYFTFNIFINFNLFENLFLNTVFISG